MHLERLVLTTTTTTTITTSTRDTKVTTIRNTSTRRRRKERRANINISTAPIMETLMWRQYELSPFLVIIAVTFFIVSYVNQFKLSYN